MGLLGELSERKIDDPAAIFAAICPGVPRNKCQFDTLSGNNARYVKRVDPAEQVGVPFCPGPTGEILSRQSDSGVLHREVNVFLFQT